ncbi:hypothetical protein [Amycolatopsis sp.]|nr:hypothetical protein [Amycolatopsis sp.]HVV12162.1 hypothetical protein [Amycolatopsis sp.]
MTSPRSVRLVPSWYPVTTEDPVVAGGGHAISESQPPVVAELIRQAASAA